MTPVNFRGQWLVDGDPYYDAARPVWNLRVDTVPNVIARCLGPSDVAAAIAYARDRALPIHVRCSGWTFGAGARSGVVIDLSLMRGVQIEPERRVARVQGGVRSGDLQTEAAVHGLAGVTGVVSNVGVGAWLAGGIGFLGTRAGYASDNILAIELVTASGEVVTASPVVNPDLFWAVRGSTGNFGVVTALEVRLHEVPPLVHGGMMSWSLGNLEGPVHALRDQSWASDGLSLIGVLGSASLDGRGGLDIVMCHSGPDDEARADLDRLRSFGEPDEDGVSTMPFRDLTFAFDDGYPPMRAVIDEQPVDVLSDELVAALVRKIHEPAGSGARFVELVPRSGAYGRAPEHPSAMRESADPPMIGIGPGALWNDADEDAGHIRWVEQVMATTRAIGPVNDHRHPGGIGVSLDPDAVRRVYGDRFERLRKLKRRWDPDNVFIGSHNIPPAQGA